MSPTPGEHAPAVAADQLESYQYVGENSKVHFEMRAQLNRRHFVQLEAATYALLIVIGITLALVAAASIIAVDIYNRAVERVVSSVMWSDAPACDAAADSTCTGLPSTDGLKSAYAAFVLSKVALVVVAAMLTAWAPASVGSGLPQVKAFLNGCRVSRSLHPSTLVAKVVGITLVVASGLPVGREGPMVHIGAAVAACASSVRIPIPSLVQEMRWPAMQRNWVGMGASAGVAAAFNAPLGGILYALEEVCSHWSGKQTWLSFLCSVVVVCGISLIVDFSAGHMPAGGLVVG